MYISRLLYPVEVLGPGKRVGIWMTGCVHHCPGCSNPELWTQDEKYKTDADTVMRLIHMLADDDRIDGFTVTGGDPFYQPDALRELLPRLYEINRDILVYTGYEREELPQDILRYIAVLIDGKYVQERNRGEMLRGSDNQRIWVSGEYRERYEAYARKERSPIQNFAAGNGSVISVGIHLPGYEEKLKEISAVKGLEEIENE